MRMFEAIRQILGRNRFKIIYTKEVSRGMKIWLADGIEIYVYQHRNNPFIKGNGSPNVDAVVACLRSRFGFRPTVYYG